MKDIKKILFYTILIIGIVFILRTNSKSFLSEYGYVLAEEKAEPSKAAKKNLTFQEAASKIFNKKVGSDDSGEVFHMGLTAEYTGPEELLPGEGKYGKLFKYLPVMRWYDPEHYYESTQMVEAEFTNDQCILCHMIKTPGIVAQWKKSKHATSWKKTVGCDACHGSNHMQLIMPTYKECGNCHPRQTAGHRAGGSGSHTQAFHVSTNEASWQVEKPAEEVTACAICHGKAENTCDGCHTRHGFSEAEARKPAGCAVCHRGLDHYEYEMWMQSYHGLLWASNGASWDWTKPMRP